MPKQSRVSSNPTKRARQQKRKETIHCNGIPPDFHWPLLQSPRRSLWGQIISTEYEATDIYPYVLFKLWIQPIIQSLGLQHVPPATFWSQSPSSLKDGWNHLADDRRFLHEHLGIRNVLPPNWRSVSPGPTVSMASRSVSVDPTGYENWEYKHPQPTKLDKGKGKYIPPTRTTNSTGSSSNSLKSSSLFLSSTSNHTRETTPRAESSRKRRKSYSWGEP